MKLVQKRDMVIAAIVFLLAAILYMGYQFQNRGKSPKAEIYYGAELIKTIELDKGIDEVFVFPQNENVVFHLYEDGSICFEQSDCPDQVCVHSGRLSQVGESAACLPNEFILKLVPVGDYEEDTPDLIQ